MHTDREQRVQELRSLIERGDYVLKPERIADAVVRCVAACELARAHAPATRTVRDGHPPVRAGVRVAPSRWRRSKRALMAAG